MRSTVFLLAVLGICLGSVGWALLSREAPAPLPPLRLEVLNGCGENGLANTVATELRRLGQDVLLVGDAEHHEHSQTVLVDRRGRAQITRRLARRIGVSSVVLEARDDAEVDATLILGADHKRLSFR